MSPHFPNFSRIGVVRVGSVGGVGGVGGNAAFIDVQLFNSSSSPHTPHTHAHFSLMRNPGFVLALIASTYSDLQC